MSQPLKVSELPNGFKFTLISNIISVVLSFLSLVQPIYIFHFIFIIFPMLLTSFLILNKERKNIENCNYSSGVKDFIYVNLVLALIGILFWGYFLLVFLHMAFLILYKIANGTFLDNIKPF